MAIIKCKMCGGDLNLVEGASTAECEYCGSVQTIPNLDDEKKLIQFERAERLRKQCEFDKAAGIYENIVADFRQEAEAYWGLVLCKYGIEYVDDPATGKKIPTCHRSSFDSIMEDSDFEQVLENADGMARRVYREEAKAIEELRKGIIAVSANEQPYDIFICYKETAEDGDRTLDSVLAQDVYDALTDKGYRVFFSRISLEDKLGVEYEPYIFAALNSAKIMLAFGTDYEYFNAVWVKNEWSRFLKLMAKDKEKHLIPCYKGIDAYDMPKEFGKLQAQDLGKVGAIQDLLRGIEKLLPRQVETVKENLVVQDTGSGHVQALLKRGNMALEDENWIQAEGFFENVLNQNAECSEAYLGMALAKAQCHTMDALFNKRREVTLSTCGKLLYLPACTEHIQQMVQRYFVENYVSAQEIVALYDFDLSYRSNVQERKEQYEQEEKYWAEHKLLIRAEKFATVAMAERFTAEKKALFATLQERIAAAETAEAVAKAELETRYAQYVQQADLKAEQLHQKGVEKRETYYVGLVNTAQTSSNLRVLKDTENKLRQLNGYKDSVIYADLCATNYEKFYAELCERLKKIRKRNAVVQQNMIYGLVGTDCRCHDSHADRWKDKFDPALQSSVCMRISYQDASVTSRWASCTGSVSAFYNFGLCIDGTVKQVSTFDHDDDIYSRISTYKLTDIVRLIPGNNRLLALDRQGGFHALAVDFDDPIEKLGKNYMWQNLVDVATDVNGTILGLKKDGTVVAVDRNCKSISTYQDWKNIAALIPNRVALALTADGRIVSSKPDEFNHKEIFSWTELVAFAGDGNMGYVGLRVDGTVLCTYGCKYRDQYKDLTDVVAISDDIEMCICANGKVVSGNPKKNSQLHNIKLFQNIDTLQQERLDIWKEKIAKSEARCQEYQAGIDANKGLFRIKERKHYEDLLSGQERILKELRTEYAHLEKLADMTK